MDLRTVTNKVSGKDYAKALRLCRWAFLVILAIGLVWLGCNVWLVPHYDLNDYVRSFYLGGALGMTGGGLAFLLHNEWMLHHPEAWKRARIRETDERKQRIEARAAQIAGRWLQILQVPIVLVLLLVDLRLALVIVCFMGLYSLLYLIAWTVLSRRM